MPTYVITLNGKSYEVNVQLKNDNPVATVAPTIIAAPVAVPAAAPAPAAAAVVKAAAPAAAAGDDNITAPMPGKVVEVKVSAGDSVKKGQELVIVEAMKMNNPILAPGPGRVKAIFVNAGDAIQTGSALLALG